MGNVDSRSELRNQLNRRNQTPEQISYFRGKLYEQRKKQGRRNDLTYDQNEQKLASDQIGKEYGVSGPTIRRDADFAKAIDTIGKDAAHTCNTHKKKEGSRCRPPRSIG